MQISENQINELGQVRGFRFHDASIVGLSYDDEGPLLVRFRRPDGSVAVLSLSRSSDILDLVGSRTRT